MLDREAEESSRIFFRTMYVFLSVIPNECRNDIHSHSLKQKVIGQLEYLPAVVVVDVVVLVLVEANIECSYLYEEK